MKNIIILLLLAFCVSPKAKSQSSNAVYPHEFVVDNNLEDNKIEIHAEGLTIVGSLSINIQTIISSFRTTTTNLAIIDGQTVLFAEEGPSFYKESDFHNNSYISNAKNFTLNVSNAIVSNIIFNHPNAKLVVRYKFGVQGDGILYPRSSENIGQYYIGNDKYGFVDKRTVPIIDGPQQIETEGVYNVKNAISVSILNSAANPTQDATLQNIGGGKYLVKRVGNFAGHLLLKAVNSTGESTFKDIQITGAPSKITGPDFTCSDATYIIENPGILTLENAAGIASLNHVAGNEYRISRIGSAVGTIILKSENEFGITSKTIQIADNFLNGMINSPVMINLSDPGTEFEFIYSSGVDEGNVTWTSSNSNIAFTPISSTKAIMNILPSFTFPPGSNRVNVEIFASGYGICGAASQSTTVQIRK